MTKQHLLTFLGLVLIMVSCTRNADTINNPADTVTSGSWRVSLFNDSGNDETADFSGYSFLFNSDGTITAAKSGLSANGAWSLNSSSNKFIIDLGPKTDTNKPLGELTDDWVIISSTATELKLKDDNSASNEFLTFSRN